ncbi:zinc finger protein 808-like [Contarinia nasturtii]|uniref:zinc finger protein 808-like n=1 Tax=Contarinia nasturtii TaxID=265458 RepID=UPI0012D49F12|nr:zinc finger protein 808-like [Contarinia nasturtii]
MTSFLGELNTMQIQTNKDAYECRICDNVFPSPFQLTVHCIIMHELLPCIQCLKLFECEQLLNDHKRIHHENDKHVCAECSNEFPTESHYLSHASLVHSMKLCTLCEQLISIKDQQQHNTFVHKTDNSCQIKLFTVPVKQNEFSCHLCNDNKSVDRLDKLFLHYLYYHKCSMKSLIRCFINDNIIINCIIDANEKCSNCELKYTWSVPKMFHQIYCLDQIYCKNCKHYFNKGEKYSEHLKDCHPNVTQSRLNFCDNCPSENELNDAIHFNHVHNFSSQCSWHQVTSLLNANNHCYFCSINLSSKVANLNELIDHFRIVHRFNAMSILSYLKTGENKRKTMNDAKIRCDTKRKKENIAEIFIDGIDNIEYSSSFDTSLVKYVYSSVSDYDSTDSENDRPRSSQSQSYQCELCDFRSKSKFVHAMHMHKRHGFMMKTPEFRCNVCAKIFTSNRSLRKHNQTSHHKFQSEKRFGCSFCEFRCNAKGKMRQHISEHIEASYHPCHSKDIGYSCKFCHFIFWTREMLSSHQMNRHSDRINDMYLICGLCYSTFNNLSTLRYHNKSRHFEFKLDDYYAFQCTICRIVLYSIDAIGLHMQQCHEQSQSLHCAKKNCMQIVSNETELKRHWAAHHTKSIFQCLECYKKFERREFVENHIAVAHTNIK